MGPWKRVTEWGILRDGDRNAKDAAFWAGHINDVLRLNVPPFFPTLVASETSGVWLVNELGGPALALSWEWDQPALNCLATGIYTDLHVYAAGDALFESDTTTSSPILNWRKIPIGTDPEHLLEIGTIHRVVVVRERSKLVLAADGGVFWATIPPVAGGMYSFKQAVGLDGMRCSGLAEATETNVVAGVWGTDDTSHFGLFHGDWTSTPGELVFTRASISGPINQRQMLRTEIAACAGDRSRLYAVCDGGGNLTIKTDGDGKPVKDSFGNFQYVDRKEDLIYRVLASGDGGLKWEVTGDLISGTMTDKLFGGPKDFLGKCYLGYCLCIGVSPFDPEVVAVGVGGVAISEVGGALWRVIDPKDSKHLHEDTHALVFDPFTPGMYKLYIGSDGGLAWATDSVTTFSSLANRQFTNFQVFRLGASPANSGVIAVSLQDNGDDFTDLYANPDPWTRYDGGDGVLSMFLGTGHFIHHNNTTKAPDASGTQVEFGNRPRAASWDDAKRTFKDLKLFPTDPLSRGVIPIDGTADGLINPAPEPGNENVIEVVDTPSWTNGAGELMVGVAAEAEAVYGLFDKGPGGFAWTQLGAIPHMPDKDPAGNELPYMATAAASLDGSAIFVGTNNGKIFRLNAPGWSSTDISIPKATAPITRFALVTPTLQFVVAASQVFRRSVSTWKDVTPVTPAPTSPMSAVVTDRADPSPSVYASSTETIWKSENQGDSWFAISFGLPRAAQIRDMRFNTESSGVSFLYAATFGWGTFRNLLDFDEVLKPATVDGHMDIVDRVAIGHDDWAHPVFSNTVSLGPLHPFETMLFPADDGDEIHVDLKLHLAWHSDFSVVVDFDATLFAKDEDNAIDDHQAGSFTVAWGTSQTTVVDLASDELWPDRAHIEFKVSNP